MGLKIDRCDSRCALCREAEADKTGSHLAPNFMIHGMFSFDGKGRRNREISMRDHLNTSERMVYYGPEVSPEDFHTLISCLTRNIGKVKRGIRRSFLRYYAQSL